MAKLLRFVTLCAMHKVAMLTVREAKIARMQYSIEIRAKLTQINWNVRIYSNKVKTHKFEF